MTIHIPRPTRISKHAAQLAHSRGKAAVRVADKAANKAGKGASKIAGNVANNAGKVGAVAEKTAHKAGNAAGKVGAFAGNAAQKAGQFTGKFAGKVTAGGANFVGGAIGGAKQIAGNGYNQAAETAQDTKAFIEAQKLNATRATSLAARRANEAATGVIYTMNLATHDVVDQLTNPALTTLGGKILKAIADAVDHWKLQAEFSNISIMGPSAIGLAGCLDGPRLEPHIVASPEVANLTGAEGAIRDAVASAVSDCFEIWQSGVTVPSLPWYPTFIAFPAPFAPLTANIPMPLASCVSVNSNKLVLPFDMKQAILAELPSELPDLSTFANAMASNISSSFSLWLALANVFPVLGTGPVPTFSLPIVPVGPVMSGYVLPGQHLMSAPRLQTIPLPSF